MIRRTFSARCLLLLWLTALLLALTFPAAADVPAGLNPPYQQGDSSPEIRQIKERMQELGYFTKGAALTNAWSGKMTERVRLFREKNGLPASDIVDSEFLSVLYSDQAVTASGSPVSGASRGSGTGSSGSSSGESGSSSRQDASGGKTGASGSSSSRQNASGGKAGTSDRSETTHDDILYFVIGGGVIVMLFLIYLLIRRQISKKNVSRSGQ